MFYNYTIKGTISTALLWRYGFKPNMNLQNQKLTQMTKIKIILMICVTGLINKNLLNTNLEIYECYH